jgi:adenine-specific DNA-methyltransferase
MIKYLGSKRLLIPRILDIVSNLEGVQAVCDLFSGTSRVGFALKEAGYRVHANDCMNYAHVLAQTYVGTDANVIQQCVIEEAIDRLNQLEGESGYFTQKFAEEAHYFQPANAARIDAIRGAIDNEAGILRPVLLTALMEAADRVDSTVGVQMAYLKQWAQRASKPLRLRPPKLLPVPGEATRDDALKLAPEITADLVYLDPPYNQHSYLGNYHIWESLVLNDGAETYGKANKRMDCRTRTSPFNMRTKARDALETVIHSLDVRYLILSFSDEGHISRSDIERILASWGRFRCEEVPFRRHVGARIGIYNPKGELVGKVSHVHNHEFLFVAERSR